MASGWLEMLEAAGVDTQRALERFVHNETLYEKYIIKFLDDENYQMLENAYAQKDVQTMLYTVHNLMGLSGTLGFVKLFEISKSVLAALRSDEWSEQSQLFTDLQNAYKEIYEVIVSVARCS